MHVDTYIHKGTFIYLFYFLKDFIFIYLLMKDTLREAETQAEGEAGSTQGALYGARSCMPWAKAGAKVLSHWGCPNHWFKC